MREAGEAEFLRMFFGGGVSIREILRGVEGP